MGAAIHAASLVGEAQDSMLLDVTPLDLRIGVAGGLAEPVIERNTPVPIEQTRTFTTFQDHQESVQIRVYQGDHRLAEDNVLLGQFEFSGFQKGLRSDVKIDVTFEIDADGIVNVTASDQATGQEASTQITLSSGLDAGEVDEIIEQDRAGRVKTADVPPAGDAGAAAGTKAAGGRQDAAPPPLPSGSPLFGDGKEDLSIGRDGPPELDLEVSDDDLSELDLVGDEDLMQLTGAPGAPPRDDAITLDIPAEDGPEDGDLFDASGRELSSPEIELDEES